MEEIIKTPLVQSANTDDAEDNPVSLEQKRMLVDQIVSIEKSVIDPEQMQATL